MTETQVPGARVRSRRGGSTWEVRAERLASLQQLAVTSVGVATLTSLRVEVEHWRPARAGWLGSPGLPGLRSVAIEPRGTGVVVDLDTVEPVDAGLLLAGAVRCLRPIAAGDLGPELTFAPGLPAAAASLAGHLRDALLPGETRDRHVRRADILLVGGDSDVTTPDGAVTVTVDGAQWYRHGHAYEVCVDPTVHRPVGRRSAGDAVTVAGRVEGGRLELRGEGFTRTLAGDVTPGDVAALRSCRAVVADDVPGHLAHQLEACGVIVAGTGQELPADDDHLGWQARSVHDRRHALRQYGPTAALDGWPSVSVLLVTHRPDHLAHAMRQVAALRYPRLEVVIGAHGDRVDAARVWELAQEVPHPVTVLAIDGGRTLGEALRACSDRAEGALVTKMDDDDVYGPEHVWDLVLARQYSGAQLVGKALDWVRIESADVTVFRPTYAAEKYTDFVAGGTILISRADLAAVGGWRPVPKSVDRALLDRVLAAGGLVYRTHGLGYVYVRHSAGHTATVADEHFLTRTTATYPGLLRHAAFGTDAPLPEPAP